MPSPRVQPSCNKVATDKPAEKKIGVVAIGMFRLEMSSSSFILLCLQQRGRFFRTVVVAAATMTARVHVRGPVPQVRERTRLQKKCTYPGALVRNNLLQL